MARRSAVVEFLERELAIWRAVMRREKVLTERHCDSEISNAAWTRACVRYSYAWEMAKVIRRLRRRAARKAPAAGAKRG